MGDGMTLSDETHPCEQRTGEASSFLGKENDHARTEVEPGADSSAGNDTNAVGADGTKENAHHESDGVENEEADLQDPDVLRCEQEEASPDIATDKAEGGFTERIIASSTMEDSIISNSTPVGSLEISMDGQDAANCGIDGVEIVIEIGKGEEVVDIDQECLLNGSDVMGVGVQIRSGNNDGDAAIVAVDEEEGNQVQNGVAYGRLDASAGPSDLEVSDLGASVPGDTMQEVNEVENKVFELDNRNIDDENDEASTQGLKADKKRARGQWEDTQKASRAKPIDEGATEFVGDAASKAIEIQESIFNAVNLDSRAGDGEVVDAQNCKAPPIFSETTSGADGKGGKDDLSDCMNAERKRARGGDVSSGNSKFQVTPLSSSQEEVGGLVKPNMMQDAKGTLPTGVDANGVAKPQNDASAKDCEGNADVDLDGGGREEMVTSLEEKEGAEKGSSSRSRASKRRKIAILLAYCGAGYQGMQKNPGAITIEGLLEEALFKAGAIPENHYGDPRKVDWMRAARTDKGVSAVGQVVSGLFCVDPPGFVERVNSHLPKQIRVLGYKRVIPTFSAKKYCDRRRYEYVIPVFAFDPSAHRDRESVLASEGQGEALTKCQECSERGRKVPGAVGKRQVRSAGPSNDDDEKLGVVSADKASEDREEVNILIDVEGGTKKEIPLALESNRECEGTAGVISMDGNLSGTLGPKEAAFQGTAESMNGQQIVESIITERIMEESDDSKQSDQPPIKVEEEEEREQLPSSFLREESSSSELTETSVSEPRFQAGLPGREEKCPFKFGEEQRSRFNHILRCFVGTHNFHNFTTRIKAEDPSAKRYIVSFEASEVFTVGNMEFVRCTIVGQSFMLHQIRKMIGLAVAIFRNCAPESMLPTALRRDVHVNIPTAPELGLFLDECMYPAYNQKWCKIHGEISQRGFEEIITKFKHEFIYDHIAASEAKDGLMALFLHSLNDRNFPDFMTAREAEKLKAC